MHKVHDELCMYHLCNVIIGKGVSIWDTFTHQTPSPILDESNGDIACLSYHKSEEDVQLLKNMGVWW